ncbi:MAG: PfkB family carbohydrate kinase [Oscillospiraceae bacterium]
MNRCEYEELQFGGKGLNVSAVLTNLGIPTTALGFTAGFTGQILEDKLHEAGVATDFIRLDAGMARINVKIRAQEVTEINGRGPRIGPEALKALVQKLDTLDGGDILVLAGSIPMGLDNAIYEDLLRYVQGRESCPLWTPQGFAVPGAAVPAVSHQASTTMNWGKSSPNPCNKRGNFKVRRGFAAEGRAMSWSPWPGRAHSCWMKRENP